MLWEGQVWDWIPASFVMSSDVSPVPRGQVPSHTADWGKKTLSQSLPREPQHVSSVWRDEGGDWEDLVLGDRKREEGDPYTGALEYSLGNLVVRPSN